MSLCQRFDTSLTCKLSWPRTSSPCTRSQSVHVLTRRPLENIWPAAKSARWRCSNTLTLLKPPSDVGGARVSLFYPPRIKLHPLQWSGVKPLLAADVPPAQMWQSSFYTFVIRHSAFSSTLSLCWLTFFLEENGATFQSQPHYFRYFMLSFNLFFFCFVFVFFLQEANSNCLWRLFLPECFILSLRMMAYTPF